MTKPQPAWLPDRQPCADKHTPTPSGYIAWHDWAEEMSKTHRQQRCPECGLWSIWVRKGGLPVARST